MSATRKPSWTSPYRIAVAARLLRVRRLNVVSILGIALGLSFIVLLVSIMDGYRTQLQEMLRGTLSDVIVEVYVSDAAVDAQVLRSVSAVEGVEAASFQLHTGGVLRAATGGKGHRGILATRIVGIDAVEERRVSKFFDYLLDDPGPERDPFATPGAPGVPGVILSARVAGKIGLKPGDPLRLLTFERMRDDDGRVRWTSVEHDVSVARLYSSGNTEYDRLHLYVDRDSNRARFFADSRGTIREVRVRLAPVVPDGLFRSLQAAATVAGPDGVSEVLAIDTWQERQVYLLRMINNQKASLSIVMFFIVLVGCFNIFATLTMTVAEKVREIGVLRALGATRGGVLSIFLLNGGLVGGTGAAAGYLLGLLMVAYINPARDFLKERLDWDLFPEEIYLFPEIPTFTDHAALMPYAVGAVIAAVLFAFPPAFRAARMLPVNALRAR